jgi:hypothetical protein
MLREILSLVAHVSREPGLCESKTNMFQALEMQLFFHGMLFREKAERPEVLHLHGSRT